MPSIIILQIAKPEIAKKRYRMANYADSMSSGEDEEDDMMMTMDPSDERMKKKQQNSVRWKRWWLKNREAYNEKRRLSAQLRSARNRANKEKALLQQQEALANSLTKTSPQQVPPPPPASAKRMKRTTVQQLRQESLPTTTAVANPSTAMSNEVIKSSPVVYEPSISPAHLVRSFIPSMPLMGSFSSSGTQHPVMQSLNMGLPMMDWNKAVQTRPNGQMLPNGGPYFPQFQQSFQMMPYMFGANVSGVPSTHNTPSAVVANLLSTLPQATATAPSMYLTQ
jgi:hypothetical protein